MAGTVLGACLLISVMLLGASWLQYLALSHNNFAAVVASVLADLANSDRRAHGAVELRVSERLMVAAQAKANDMARIGYFSHNGPDGKEPWDWIREAGYDYKFAGENLAIQFSDSIDVERAWLASPMHRANILDTRFTEVGIATAYGLYQGQPTTLVVQMFGVPREVSPAKPVISSSESHIERATESEDEIVVLGVSSEELTPQGAEAAAQASFAEHVVASPHTSFRYAYQALLIFLLLFVAYLLVYELRQKHTRHSIYALMFALVLGGALFVADKQLFKSSVVTHTGTSFVISDAPE